MSKLVNFVGFQAGWFACVLGAGKGHEWLGPLFVLAWCGWFVRSSDRPARSALALLFVGALGTLVGVIEIALGWLAFQGATLAPWIAPPWILALWLLFATTFDSSLAWLTKRSWSIALFSLFGAPLSYLAGERLGPVAILEPRWSALVGIGVLWGLALPIAASAFRRLLRPSERDEVD